MISMCVLQGLVVSQGSLEACQRFQSACLLQGLVVVPQWWLRASALPCTNVLAAGHECSPPQATAKGGAARAEAAWPGIHDSAHFPQQVQGGF